LGLVVIFSFTMMILSSCWGDLTHMGKEMFIMKRIGDHIHKPLDHGWVRDNNLMSKQALTLALNFSSKINPYSHVIHKLKIFILFLCAWLRSIFVANNIASWIPKLTHLVARCHGWKILWLGATTPPLLSLACQSDLTWSLVE
jgi:hypothetical protein